MLISIFFFFKNQDTKPTLNVSVTGIVRQTV